MDFNVKSGRLEKQDTDCIVIPLFTGANLPSCSASIDDATDSYISHLIEIGDFSAKLGKTLLLHDLEGIKSPRVLLVGCGNEDDYNDNAFKSSITAMITTLKDTGCEQILCCLTELEVPKRDISWKIQQAIITVNIALYNFENYKSKKSKNIKLQSISWMASNKKALEQSKKSLLSGKAISIGMKTTKDLANIPANDCTPSYLAKTAKDLAKQYKSLTTTILERKDMQNLKMGALLSVAAGSEQDPKLITLQYKGSKNSKPYIIVGKGITFDTGGNSLKQPQSMIGMKYDMCGAATVLGVMQFVAEMKLPLHVIGVIAAAENMPGSKASRPDDIVTSMSGTTIEILNTDAEGRLILSDALTYCEQFNPEAVIDVATLTGACVVALGQHHSAVYSNNPNLSNDLFEAGQKSTDKCWPMPLGEEYTKQLESNIADLCNIGGPEAGSITAACFLEHFAKKLNWAHLDVAGSACRFTGKDRGATGRPVPLLAEYLLQKCN